MSFIQTFADTVAADQEASTFNYPSSIEQGFSPPLLCNANTSTMNPSDWPAQAWPQPEYDEDSTISSSASNDVYRDGTWNPFDDSFSSYNPNEFAAANQYGSSSNETSPLDPQFDPNPNPQQWRNSFVSLSAINESAMDSYDEGAQDCENTPKPNNETSPLPSLGLKLKNQRRSSRAPRETKANSPRLRSTATSHRRSSTSSIASTSSTTRTNHNAVEKQYRNRLNGQFQTLLQALPQDCNEDLGDGLVNGQDKKVSKAEVLMLAKKRIGELEQEKMVLEKEHRALQGVVGELRQRWRGVGGVMLP
jgi:ATP-dependent exoDNAse (exonuclease V) beta subunit